MKQSNLYIFVYASVMVVVVAAVLALASTSLRPAQQKNIDTEKRLDILKSVGAAAEVASAPSKDLYVSEEYGKTIVDQYAVNVKGEKVDGVDVFRLDLKVELDKPADQRV
ncbi:MAG TPA: NADH:ubiquinone reductase (Na(+)-transporting) subunit C, partial [Tenuifilaceae bacterium]|nr:NADH:ubiquinone reductase (Na(+)-transporting) subunit C [Tenuifilaceae bacterium]